MARGLGAGRWAWTVATVWLPAAVLLAMTVPALLLAGRLPDPVAAHWTGGVPDGSVPRTAGLAAAAAIWAVCWASVAGLRAGTVRRLGFLLPTVLFVGGVLGATVIVALLLNLDAPRWTDAHAPGRLTQLSPLLAGVALAATGLAVQHASGDGRGLATERSRRARETRRALTVPALRLRGGDRVLWVRRVRQGPTWIAVALVGLATLGIAGTHRLLWVLLAAALVVMAALMQATVWIDRRGVRVGLGPWGWPARRIALEHVRSVSVVEVDPADFGGWGYRLWRSRTNAIVLHRGEALRVESDSGRVLVVTVDGAREAAAVLLGLRDAEGYYAN